MKMFKIFSTLPIFPINVKSEMGNYMVQVQADEVLGDGYQFNIRELMALNRILDKHFIPYEDEEAHTVLRRIDTIIREANGMVNETS